MFLSEDGMAVDKRHTTSRMEIARMKNTVLAPEKCEWSRMEKMRNVAEEKTSRCDRYFTEVYVASILAAKAIAQNLSHNLFTEPDKEIHKEESLFP